MNYEEKYKEFDALDPSKQQFILNQIGETAGSMTGGNIISSLAQKGLDNSKVALKESEIRRKQAQNERRGIRVGLATD